MTLRPGRLGGKGGQTDCRQTGSDDRFAPEGSFALADLNQVFHRSFVFVSILTGANRRESYAEREKRRLLGTTPN
jgi:hypothetical protein